MVNATASKEEARTQGPLVKFCQTGTLLLVSIMEANLKEDDVNVSIEEESIRVEIARDGIKNPIMEGKLLKAVKPDQCRVRMKDDSVVIKLRKAESSRWKSILEKSEDSDDADRKITPSPESRIQPTPKLDTKQMRQPIEPREERKAVLPDPKATAKAQAAVAATADKKASAKSAAASPPVQPSDTFFENLKNSLCNTVSFTTQHTVDDSDDDILNFEGPLVRHRTLTAAE